MEVKGQGHTLVQVCGGEGIRVDAGALIHLLYLVYQYTQHFRGFGLICYVSRVRTIPAITSILDTSILDSDRYRYSIPSITTLVTS